MTAFSSKKSNTVVVQKVMKAIPTAARASTAVKSSFKQAQLPVRNRISRRLLKNRFIGRRYRSIRRSLVVASKVSRDFVPPANIDVLITQKRMEDACSVR